MASVVVVAPQIEEAEALVGVFRSNGARFTSVRVGRMTCTALPGLDILVAVGGNGKAQFAVQTQYLLDRCPAVKLLFCVGAAGSLQRNLTIGDVAVATVTVEHDFAERFAREPVPTHEGDPTVLRQLARVAAVSHLPFRVHFGPVASGDEDIVDDVRATEVRRATGGICVAWEGSGGARAARFSGVAFVEIRAITDAADARAATSFRKNVGSAVANVGHLLMAWRASSQAQ